MSLLNDAREKTEVFIDILYEPLKEKINKPRTYRRLVKMPGTETVARESLVRESDDTGWV